MKVRDFLKLYFAFLILHLATLYRAEYDVLYYLSKPLLMTALLIFFIHKTENYVKPDKWWIISALFFALLGDGALLYEKSIFFLLGMGAFAFTHLSYIGWFLKNKPPVRSLPGLLLGLLLGIIGFLTLHQGVSLPDAMILPVNAYAFLLVLSTLAGMQFGMGYKNYLVPLGLVLFMSSDLLLAYNRFEISSTYQEMGVMSLYALAQLCLVTGILRWMESRNTPQ